MQQHIHEPDVTSYQGKWGKKGLLDCLDSFFSFSKINTKIDPEMQGTTRQRILRTTRIQHQCLRERAAVKEKH